MKYAFVALTTATALALGAFGLRAAHAQNQAVPVLTPDQRTAILAQQVQSLQAAVTALQASNAALTRVVQIGANNAVTISAPTQLTLSSTMVNLKATGTLNETATGIVAVKGSMITLN
jgi:hypothetical protein